MEEERKREPGEVHPQFWKNTVKEAFKNDPIRIIIELIKNAADSYTRMKKKEEASPPFRIFVEIYCSKGAPTILVTDHAEGMDYEKLKDALKYGTQTSRGEDIDAVTSAEKGIGLKDAMMALKDNWLTTIKDGLINERKKYPNFDTGIGKEDEKATEKERTSLKIPGNGTRVKGKLPDYFKEKRFQTICEHLEKHFLLRKLLQDKDYEIYAINLLNDKRKRLIYMPPEIEKQLYNDIVEINYNNKTYPVHISIAKSKEPLSQGKPYGKSGTLFYYGDYSILDNTLGRYERDPAYSKIVGDAKMEVGPIIRDPNEPPLVDEKRRGLDREHEFNKILLNKYEEILKVIKEEDEESKYSLDKNAKRNVLKELNKLCKEIKGRGPPPELPIKPETFAFYPTWIKIKEYEPKRALLIINTSLITEDITINLATTNRDIITKQASLIIKKEEVEGDLIAKHIEVYSEKAKAEGEIVATLEKTDESQKVGVEVLENPIFAPKEGFAFIPDKTKIVDGGEKKVSLCIDKKILRSTSEIIFTSEDPINCPGKWILPKSGDYAEYELKNILKIDIPIKVKGKGHIGEKATITASYEDKWTTLKVNIIQEPEISGLFRDIQLSAKETKKISDFNEDEGILEIYYKHPLIKKYMKKNFTSRTDFLVFVGDVITREAVRTIVVNGVEENSSSFPIFDMDHKEVEIEYYIMVEYHKQGSKMHELFSNLAKTFKIK